MIRWEQANQEFVFDGSLRDLYVLHTDLSDWERMLDFVGDGSFPFPFILEDEVVKRLPKAAVLFADPENRVGSTLLSVRVGNMWLNCHFFTTDEIEFDLDPREVLGAADFEALLGFMQSLGQTLNQPVILTTEGFCENSEKPIFSYSPDTGTIDYNPHGGYG